MMCDHPRSSGKCKCQKSQSLGARSTQGLHGYRCSFNAPSRLFVSVAHASISQCTSLADRYLVLGGIYYGSLSMVSQSVPEFQLEVACDSTTGCSLVCSVTALKISPRLSALINLMFQYARPRHSSPWLQKKSIGVGTEVTRQVVA